MLLSKTLKEERPDTPIHVDHHTRPEPIVFVPNADALTATLTERGSRYGKFTGHSFITQELKRQMQKTTKWVALADDQKESLEMIAHKIGRILNGDPNYADSWVDIAGYAKLVADRLEGAER